MGGSSGGSGSGNTVTRVEPASYQLPHLNTALGTANRLFNEGGPQQYTGNTIVPFAPQTEDALAATEARARAGSAVTGGAQDYVTRTLAGDYLNQGNPYLDVAIGKAADKSYQTLSSQFARGGRNIDAAAPLQADILTDLTARMYGDAYNAERERQQGVLPFVSPLAESDYRDLAALRGVGAEVEGQAGQAIDDVVGRWNFEQNRPEANLDAYLGRVVGVPGSTQTTTGPPMQRNRGAGVMGGAMLGGSLASLPAFAAMGPLAPIGLMLGGGLLGGLFGD